MKKLILWIKKYLIPISKKYCIKYLEALGYEVTKKGGK